VTVEWGRDKARHWLGILDNNLLGPERRFLGGERPTLADFVGAEMANLGNLLHCTYHDFPNVCRWLGNMKALPHWSRTNRGQIPVTANIRKNWDLTPVFVTEVWRRIHAYCLMANHVHLLVTPERTDSD